MKKITVILIAVMMLVALFAIPTAAEDATYVVPCDIVITGMFSNPNTVPYDIATTKDFVEYLEILNVSDHDVDLYDYTFYYVNKSDPQAVIDAASAGTYSKTNVFADEPGQNVIKPGEFAIIWFVSQEVYDYQENHKIVTVENGVPNYNPDKYWEVVSSFAFDFCGWTAPEKVNGILIPWDISTSYGRGSSKNFNLANPKADKACGYFICDRDMPVETFLTGSIVPNTSISSDIEYSYDLCDGRVLSLVNEMVYDITPSMLHPDQKNLAAKLGITVEYPAEETTPAETTPAETTPAETTPIETTPDETEPAETPAETEPVNTPTETTPADATPDPKKGCGSAMMAPALLMACIPAILIGKKKRK